tara:strand:- start:565 stop:5052 length:4488 start_codon:yes stop_codon:yes gene_type:complete
MALDNQDKVKFQEFMFKDLEANGVDPKSDGSFSSETLLTKENLLNSGNLLLNTGEGGNPYLQINKLRNNIQGIFRSGSKYNKEAANLSKNFDGDEYQFFLDDSYEQMANSLQKKADETEDISQKEIYLKNKDFVLKLQADFKKAKFIDDSLRIGGEFFEFPHDLILSRLKGGLNIASFIAGDGPIYALRFGNHLLNTLGQDGLQNFLMGGRLRAEAETTEDVENRFGEKYDPNIITERSGAFLRGYQKSKYSPEGLRRWLDDDFHKLFPYLSESFGEPIVRDVAETIFELLGLHKFQKASLLFKGKRGEKAGEEFVTRMEQIANMTLKESIATYGRATTYGRKFVPGFSAAGYNRAIEAYRGTQAGQSILRKQKLGHIGFAAIIGTDHLYLDDFLATFPLPTSDLPVVGKEGAIPLFIYDTPAIYPVGFVASFGAQNFGSKLVERSSSISASIQLGWRAKAINNPLLPETFGPRYLNPISGRFGQLKTSKDVIDNYLANTKKVSPREIDILNKNIDALGETIIADRRGGKGTYTVHDKLLEMYAAGQLSKANRKNTAVNPLMNTETYNLAVDSFIKKMDYMGLTASEVNAYGLITEQIAKLPDAQRQPIIDYINKVEQLKETVTSHFLQEGEDGVFRVKEKYANPNRLGPNARPLTLDDVTRFQLFLDEYIGQGLFAEVRNGIATSADMGVLGSNLDSVLNNERLDIIKQEEANITALTQMHNAIVTALPTDNVDINNFMEASRLVLASYRKNNAEQQNKIVTEINNIKDLARLEIDNRKFPDLKVEVEKSIGKSLTGEPLSAIVKFENNYNALVGGKKGYGAEYEGQKNLGIEARIANKNSITSILGDRKRGIDGIVGEAYNKVRLNPDGTDKTVLTVFPNLTTDEILKLNEVVVNAEENAIVKASPNIANITPEVPGVPRQVETETLLTGEEIITGETPAQPGKPQIVELNPEATIDSLIAARSYYYRLQTEALSIGDAGAAKSARDNAQLLTGYLNVVPGFKKANKVFKDYAGPIDTYISKKITQIEKTGEQTTSDFNIVTSFIDFALKEPELAGQFVNGKYINADGEIINGYKIFGNDSINMISQGIAHLLYTGELTTKDFKLFEKQFFNEVYKRREDIRSPLTGQKQIEFGGRGNNLQEMVNALESLPVEVRRIVEGVSGDLQNRLIDYEMQLTNLDKILASTQRGEEDPVAFIKSLGKTEQSMKDIRADITKDTAITVDEYNSSIMFMVSEQIFDRLAAVSVKGIDIKKIGDPGKGNIQTDVVVPGTGGIIPQVKVPDRFENIFGTEQLRLPADAKTRKQLAEQSLSFEQVLKGQSEEYAKIIKEFEPIIRVHGTKEQIADIGIASEIRDLMQLTTDKGIKDTGTVLNIPKPMGVKQTIGLVHQLQRQIIGPRWFLTMLGISELRNRNARFLSSILMNPVNRDVIYKITEGQTLTTKERSFAEDLLFVLYPSASEVHPELNPEEQREKDKEYRLHLQENFPKILGTFIK